MKKFLLLLLTVLVFTSCIDSYRSDDFFVVISKQKRNTEYKYLYRIEHYMTLTRSDSYYLTDYNFVSNENYELGDTIRLVKSDN